MSLNSTLQKLPQPIQKLTSLTSTDPSTSGKSDNDKAEVQDWLSKVAEGSIVKSSGFKDLDAQITPKTYLVSNYFTVADAALYGALWPTFTHLKPSEYYSHPALTRYFDHIQNLIHVRKAADGLAPEFAVVPLDLDDMPKVERKADPPKKKAKATDAAAASSTPAAQPAKPQPAADAKPPKKQATSVPAEKSTQKKEKEPKAKKPAENKGGNKAEESGDPIPSMIDLRVGHIIDVIKHPDADGLYVEQIDLGEETGPRTVVSGLVHYIPIEQMRDRYLIVVCNLKPASMRGVKSYGMVLAATSKDGKDAGLELVAPPSGSKPGDRVYFEGEYENGEPVSQMNPKKKIFETIQPGLTTLDTREAAWVDPATKKAHKLRTKLGYCAAPTLVGASLS